jgi:hypothetical protein
VLIRQGGAGGRTTTSVISQQGDADPRECLGTLIEGLIGAIFKTRKQFLMIRSNQERLSEIEQIG